MNKLVHHLIFSIGAIVLLGACSSCSTTRNPSIQYLHFSRPDLDAAISTLQITQKMPVIDESGDSLLTKYNAGVDPATGAGSESPTIYINIWRHGTAKTIQTQGVDHVIDLGNESIIVLRDGRQIRTHNVSGDYDYLNGQ
jgi:hypothetical protein